MKLIIIFFVLTPLGFVIIDSLKERPTRARKPPSLEVPRNEEPIAVFDINNLNVKLERLIANKKYSLARVLIEEDRSILETSYEGYLKDISTKITLFEAWHIFKTQGCIKAYNLFNSLAGNDTHYGKLSSKGRAICLLQRKDFWQAKLEIIKYIKLKKNDIDAYTILTKCLDYTTEYQLNIGYLKDAKKLDWTRSDRLKLDSLIEQVRNKIKISNSQIMTSHGAFSISHEADINNTILSLIANSLDSSLENLVSRFGFEYPSSNIDINVYSAHNFKKVHNGPSWAGAVYDGKIRLPVNSNSSVVSKNNIERVLKHELTHALLSDLSSSRVLPSWFNEGLAQYVECEDDCNQNRASVTESDFLPEAVLKASFVKLKSHSAAIAYSQSLHLIKVLVNIKGKDSINQIVESISENTKDSDALLAPVDLSFEQLYQTARRTW